MKLCNQVSSPLKKENQAGEGRKPEFIILTINPSATQVHIAGDIFLSM